MAVVFSCLCPEKFDPPLSSNVSRQLEPMRCLHRPQAITKAREGPTKSELGELSRKEFSGWSVEWFFIVRVKVARITGTFHSRYERRLYLIHTHTHHQQHMSSLLHVSRNPNVNLWPFNPKPCHLYDIPRSFPIPSLNTSGSFVFELCCTHYVLTLTVR